jgi:signal transduction histidine kinase
MDELREVCAGLYPPVVEHGLELVVKEVAGRFKEAFGLQVVLTTRLPEEDRTGPEIAAVVYQVLSEALNNIIKHAGTREARVELYTRNGTLVLEVADEGVGSALPALAAGDLFRRQHLGVVGMLDRARSVGGNLTIAHNEPSGTKVVLEIP